ncbi:MAG: hypothetical protein RLZ12_869 [Bacillota bacterium]
MYCNSTFFAIKWLYTCEIIDGLVCFFLDKNKLVNVYLNIYLMEGALSHFVIHIETFFLRRTFADRTIAE